MQTRVLGPSGVEVSIVGLGCNNFGGRLDFEATRKVVDKAFDLGVTLFDTADMYGNGGGSETFLGRLLGERRKDIVLATKVGWAMPDDARKRGASRRYIMRAVEDSLRRLQTDWIDLYQLHRPDPLTPIEVTLRAFDDLVHQGKVRYIGCSNLPAWQVVDALWTSRQLILHRFICCQDEYSLLARGIERELLPAIEAHGLGLLPYFPLASGMLTGKYRKGAPPPQGTRLAGTKGLADRFLTEANLETVARLERVAAERGHTLIELAFGWLLSHRVIPSVIAGATKPEQVEANVKAAAGWQLTPDDLAAVDRAYGVQ
jgi:aryl-alcohol dehydrogenase-like predicted oxidoreductase